MCVDKGSLVERYNVVDAFCVLVGQLFREVCLF